MFKRTYKRNISLLAGLEFTSYFGITSFWILFFMLYFLSFLNLAKNPFFFSGVSSAPRTPLTPVM